MRDSGSGAADRPAPTGLEKRCKVADSPKKLGPWGGRDFGAGALSGARLHPRFLLPLHSALFLTLPVATPSFFQTYIRAPFFLFLFIRVDSPLAVSFFLPHAPSFVPQGEVRCSIRGSIQRSFLRIDHRGSAFKCSPSSSRRAAVGY